MNKKLHAFLLIIAIFVVGIGVVAAQGNRNGNMNGNRNQVCDPQQPGDCLTEPQMNAYRNGGVGFVNPDTGVQWNGQQRGQMGRGAGTNGSGLYTSLPPATDGALSQEIIDLMIAGWLDEQHAYAVYGSIIMDFGDVAPLVNIQQSEAQHIVAWELLFDRYGIPVPAVPTFELPEFASVADGCATAAAAEIANFELYDTMLETFAGYPDIYQIALALRNASEFNHLPAFQTCAN